MLSSKSWLEQFQKTAAKLPRLTLGSFPTPVAMLQTQAGQFWIKDDSACSPLYGGNKVRKLEYLLADVRHRGCARLVVWGDVESHTVSATAILGSANGFAVDAVVFPYGRMSAACESAALARLTGERIQIHRARNMPTAWLRTRWLARGGSATIVPLGGSTPISCVGYVLAAIELASQIAAGECPCPDQIYVAMGTGGTVAGLLVGLVIANLPAKVVAVRTVERIVTPASRIARIVHQLVRQLNLPPDVAAMALDQLDRIDERHFGGAYRAVPDSVVRAVSMACKQGLPLEPIFTGKAMACLFQDLNDCSCVCRMFWNTHDRLGSRC